MEEKNTPKELTCPWCNGSKTMSAGIYNCPRCDGKGTIIFQDVERYDIDGHYGEWTDMGIDRNGDYVKYDDYLELYKELGKARKERDELVKM